MQEWPRFYKALLADHLERHRQMALVSGPLQVGKTTTCRSVSDQYLNWDNADDRRLLLRGPAALAEALQLERLRAQPPVTTLDELHKYTKWKGLLKGFFDSYGDRVHLIVTGSSRIDVFRRGSDSMMGRYFLYRMNPWSVGESLRTDLPQREIQTPEEVPSAEWDALWEHGGFPEPFLRRDTRFTRRWRSLRHEQLSHEDLREVAHVSDPGTMETLMQILAEMSAQQLIYSNLAREIQVSVDTVKRWINLLARLHYGFMIRPWFSNVAKALRKEPKWFQRDWSGVADDGARAETFVACHLLKAVEGWTDLGFGDFELRYLRDKQKREVDFLVVRDRNPWFLVEVKLSDTALSSWLGYFQAQTKAEHAFQMVMNLPYQQADCFRVHRPVVVPAKTLLSPTLVSLRTQNLSLFQSTGPWL
ncbi:MAG TPA: AAA family ATPase [Verrucomicrobiae bacterium]|nr:AAA family ATPase [Verrucomicrobiae bacterium]